jgi:Transcriptional regulator, AbiEi antitoxin
LAERQHGVVARRQLIAHGIGIGLIEDRVRSGHLVPLHHGVFALGHERIGVRGEAMAAVLACGPAAVLSHASAAALWGVRRSRGRIEVTRTSGHRKPHGVWLHQTRGLPSEDVTTQAGIPVTSIERTVRDMAARLDERQLERMLVEADRSGTLSWATLHEVLDRPGGWKGAGRVRRVARQVDPRAAETRSPTEVDFLALCRKAGLPLPHVNVLVGGKLVDFHWPAAGLVVETDSYRYHGDRPAFERDHESTIKLTIAGYRVLRVTHKILGHDPEPFMGLVRQALGKWQSPSTSLRS